MNYLWGKKIGLHYKLHKIVESSENKESFHIPPHNLKPTHRCLKVCSWHMQTHTCTHVHMDSPGLPALLLVHPGSLHEDRAEALLWLWPSSNGSRAWKPPRAGPGHLGFPGLVVSSLLAGLGL